MAFDKKTLKNTDNLNRGRSLAEKSKELGASKNVIEIIKETETAPSKEIFVSAIKTINNDLLLTKEHKRELINDLKKTYYTVFNFENCPEDYQELKFEAKVLSEISQISFLLMAQRLKTIQDKKLYIGEYADFKSFIENEMPVKRTTVYNYIDIISLFGVQALEQEREMEFSKLIPFIPILKKVTLEELEMRTIKKEYLQKAKTESFRDILKETADLKIQYGLVKQINYNANDIKKIKTFSDYLSKTEEVSDEAKAHLVELLTVIKKHIG